MTSFTSTETCVWSSAFSRALFHYSCPPYGALKQSLHLELVFSRALPFASIYDLLKLWYACLGWEEKAHLLYISPFLWFLALWQRLKRWTKEKNNNDGQHESILKGARGSLRPRVFQSLLKSTSLLPDQMVKANPSVVIAGCCLYKGFNSKLAMTFCSSKLIEQKCANCTFCRDEISLRLKIYSKDWTLSGLWRATAGQRSGMLGCRQRGFLERALDQESGLQCSCLSSDNYDHGVLTLPLQASFFSIAKCQR